MCVWGDRQNVGVANKGICIRRVVGRLVGEGR